MSSHTPNMMDDSPLHRASMEGNIKEVERLIKKGADVNILDNWNRTPLMYACKGNYYEVAKALIDNGADIHATDSTGMTAAHHLAATNKIPNPIGVLLYDKAIELKNIEDKERELRNIREKKERELEKIVKESIILREIPNYMHMHKPGSGGRKITRKRKSKTTNKESKKYRKTQNKKHKKKSRYTRRKIIRKRK